MEISMRVNLKKIFMTVKELMFGKVEPFTKENIKKEKSTVSEFCIRMDKSMPAAGLIMNRWRNL
jgi:hypothetical protein